MKKKISFFLAVLMIASAFAAVLPSSAATGRFTDLGDGRWSEDAILYAAGKGYMTGVADGVFDPEGELTRATVATVLWRRQGEPEPTEESVFSDVLPDEWYSRAVAWARESGVVFGVDEDHFDPDRPITREALAAMLLRYASNAPVSIPERADLAAYEDAGSVSGWAEDAMAWAVEATLIEGTEEGDLDPLGSATREQFAAIIRRYDETFRLTYNEAVPTSHYTEKPYPLVEDADVYVSPDGDDGAEGDFEHPIATFGRAVEMVRSLKQTVTDRSIVVAFKAGEYHEENVTMTAEDSGTKEFPVIYCAYGDGEAVITGGALLTEDKFEPVDEDQRSWFDPKSVDMIKKAYIGDMLPEYTQGDVPFSEDGVLWLARYPDKYGDGTDHLYKLAGSTVSENEIRISFSLLKRHFQIYRTLEGFQLYGYLTTGWFKDTLDVSGYTVDEETGDIDFWIPHPETARMGSLRYGEFPWQYCHESCFQNMSEDLTAPGEYWVDTDSLTMYVYDPHGTYKFPTKEYGVVMDGCDYVTMRGLTMTAYREKILQANGVLGLTLDRCNFSVCSSMIAMRITGRSGPDCDFRITECDFDVFAGRVLEIYGPCGVREMFTQESNFLFDNNRVSHTNLTIEWNSAITESGFSKAVLSHNEFTDCSYMGITYGGSNNVIEYNVFKHCVYNSQDCGVIYCGNSQSSWNNVIRYNLFYPTSLNGYAIYIDDNEPGAVVYGNLFFEGAVVVHDGRSNNIFDNVLVNTSVLLSTGAMSEAMEQYYETGDVDALLNHERTGAFYPRWQSFLSILDSDPVLKEQYCAVAPEIATLTVDIDRADDPGFVLIPRNYVRNNLFFKTTPSDVNAQDGYSVIEGNVCFSLDENPVFVNPTIGDYRIRSGVDFPDVHFEMMGRY